MPTFDTINSPVWGLSTLGYGVIVEGMASIRQCIGVILSTRKKTDPLRPEFGSDIYKYIDLPLDISIPNIKMAIVNAINQWEPRVKIISVKHYLNSISNPVFEITYSLVDDELIDRFAFDISKGITATSTDGLELILTAAYPENPNEYPYQITLQKNNLDVLPRPNVNGYSTIADLFAWIQSNWFFFGRWYLLTDRIVLYMKSDSLTQASLVLSVLPIHSFSCVLPELTMTQYYAVSLLINGISASPVVAEGLNTPGALLAWVQSNWNQYGSWHIEYVQSTGDSTFTDEYSTEFDTESTAIQYRLVGVSNVEGLTAELEIIPTL